MGTLQEWIDTSLLTLVKMAGPYESRDADNWLHDAYVVRLVWADQTAEKRTSPDVTYRMGIGHRKPRKGRWATQEMMPVATPELADVLDSLIVDASCYDNARSFEDFCGDLGYDTDSRKALAMYEACRTTADWLTSLVGGESEMRHLMYEVERL